LERRRRLIVWIGLKKLNRNILFTSQNMSRKIISVIFIFASLAINVFAQEPEWNLEKEKDGIKVYTRQLEGRKIKEFKAETTINANIDVLEAILRDVPNYVDWIDKLKFAEIIETVNEDEFYVYSEANIPWPFENRDGVSFDKITKNELNGEIIISTLGVVDKMPEVKGVVRMPESEGYWMLKPKDSAQTDIIYQFYGDPGGGIPEWVINAFLVDSPLKTIANLKEIAEETD
jgi:hypothetical protein